MRIKDNNNFPKGIIVKVRKNLRSQATLKEIVKLWNKTVIPSLNTLREQKDVFNQIEGIYIDSGSLMCEDRTIVVAGDSELHLLCKTSSWPYEILLLYGAKINIIAEKGANIIIHNRNGIVNIDADSSCTISVKEI